MGDLRSRLEQLALAEMATILISNTLWCQFESNTAIRISYYLFHFNIIRITIVIYHKLMFLQCTRKYSNRIQLVLENEPVGKTIFVFSKSILKIDNNIIEVIQLINIKKDYGRFSHKFLNEKSF